MIAPTLTQEWFNKCKQRGLSAHTTIGKLNVKNCKQAFNKTIPKALREEGWNAYLVIKNHRDRFKYIGFNVEKVAGRLKITTMPEFLWTGYVLHESQWYAVTGEDLVKGIIRADQKIILPEIEHDDSESNS